MNFLKLNTVILSTVVLTACGGNTNVKTASNIDTGVQINSLNIPQAITVSQNGSIDRRALNECPLQTQFSELLTQAATKKGMNINRMSNVDTKSAGYNLTAEYTQVVSQGNPFIGHNKFTQIHLTLFKDGKKISEADAGRRSGGGFGAGFKGSCSVLGRTIEANADDVVFWLKNPVNGARLGNL